ncbi:MAG: ribosomal protein methyltransferase [Verrucomicrobiota bacterium]
MVGGTDELNRRRSAAFARALEQLITPASVVLDIGTGAGWFALIAAKLGAKHVFAIETNPVVEVARQLARDNGLADRITFLHADSTQVELPEKAHIITGDLGGSLPIAGPNLPALRDAAERHLAPGGSMIPAHGQVWAGVVAQPHLYGQITRPWENGPFGLDYSRARAQVVNTPRKTRVKAAQLLSEPGLWWKMDYRHITSPHAEGRLNLPVTGAGLAHGIALWLEYRLAPGIELSAAPTQPALPIYGQFFLPWTAPVELSAGDSVEVDLRARQRKEHSYVWRWDTVIHTAEGAVKARYNQASLPMVELPHE